MKKKICSLLLAAVMACSTSVTAFAQDTSVGSVGNESSSAVVSYDDSSEEYEEPEYYTGTVKSYKGFAYYVIKGGKLYGGDDVDFLERIAEDKDFSSLNGTICVCGYEKNATNVKIPEKIKGKKVTAVVGMGDAYVSGEGYVSKTSVTIPSTVKYIHISADYPYGAFYGCSSLKKITVDKNNKYYSSVDGVLYNKKQTKLLLCPAAKTSVTIPKTTKSVATGAFFGCEKLKSIKVKSGNKYLTASSNVLYNKAKTKLIACAAKVSSVKIPSTVTTISGYSFAYCKKIKSIKIPKSVTTIGKYAFYSCDKLTSVTIPKTVKKIGTYAFGEGFWYGPDTRNGAAYYSTDVKLKVYSGTAGEKYCKKYYVSYVVLDKNPAKPVVTSIENADGYTDDGESYPYAFIVYLKKSGGFNGWELQVYDTENKKWVDESTMTSTGQYYDWYIKFGFTDDELGNVYKFRMRAYSEVGSKKLYSSWSKSFTITVE